MPRDSERVLICSPTVHVHHCNKRHVRSSNVKTALLALSMCSEYQSTSNAGFPRAMRTRPDTRHPVPLECRSQKRHWGGTWMAGAGRARRRPARLEHDRIHHASDADRPQHFKCGSIIRVRCSWTSCDASRLPNVPSHCERGEDREGCSSRARQGWTLTARAFRIGPRQPGSRAAHQADEGSRRRSGE